MDRRTQEGRGARRAGGALAVLALALAAVGLDSPGPGYGTPAPLCQPQAVASPSGRFVVHVEPSSPSGAGPALCRLTLDGERIWERELRVTPWSIGVTDEGRVGGFGYTRGIRSEDGDPGELCILVLDPEGRTIRERRLPRGGPGAPQGTLPYPVPSIGRGVVVQGALDRLLVRIAPGGGEAPETWIVHRLSTGEELVALEPEAPFEPKREYGVVDARAVPGTSLVVVQWSRSWDGGAFSLLDERGRTVWSAPMTAAPSVRDDEEARDRVLRATLRGALLGTPAPRRFRLWHAAEGLAVEHEVRPSPGEDGAWTVERVAARPHAPAAQQVDARELRLAPLGTVDLRPAQPDQSPVREVAAFRFPPGGGVELVRREEADGAFTIVEVDLDGTLVSQVAVATPWGGRDIQVGWLDSPGEPWWAWSRRTMRWTRFHPVDGTGGKPRRRLLLRAGVIDLAALPAHGPGAVVAVFERWSRPMLGAWDGEGEPLWEVEGLLEDRTLYDVLDVAVTPRNMIALLDGEGRRLHVLTPDGRALDPVELEAERPWRVLSDGTDAVVVLGREALWRIALDGRVLERVPLAAELRELDLRHAAVDRAQRVWVSDRSRILRIGRSGAIELALGDPPVPGRIAEPCWAAIASSGRILVSDRRTGAVHVFAPSGEALFVCQPLAAELAARGMWDRLEPIVDRLGSVHVPVGGGRFARFTRRGERAGSCEPGGGFVAFARDGGWWRAGAHWWEPNVVERFDRSGGRRAPIERMPGGRWLRGVGRLHVSADGNTLVILDGSRAEDPVTSLGVYDGDGRPLERIDLAEEPCSEVATSGAWIVVGSYGPERLLVRRSDRACFRIAAAAPEWKPWTFGFSPDGRELWALDVGAVRLHRFALP